MEHKKEMSVNNKPSAGKDLTQAYVNLYKKMKKKIIINNHPDTSALFFVLRLRFRKKKKN